MHFLPATEYLFWLVLFSFYVVDNIKLVPRNHVIVRENLMGGYTPLISFSQYELAGKEIKMPSLILPFSMIFLLKCDPQAKYRKSEAVRAARTLRLLRGPMLGLKVISTISFFALLAGPILTYLFGLLVALSLVFSIHLTLLLGVILVLITERKRLNLSKQQLLLQIAECIFVPAFVTNITRRISVKQTLAFDGYSFVLERSSTKSLDEVQYLIRTKLDGQIADYDPAHAGHKLYSGYKTRLGL